MSLSLLNFNYPITVNSSIQKNTTSLSNVETQGPYQPYAEDVSRTFEKFDTNKDGKISLEEYNAAMSALAYIGAAQTDGNFKEMQYGAAKVPTGGSSLIDKSLFFRLVKQTFQL